ncbi:MAG TPA: TetR family transcriptional regulator [Candidatus Nanopelagicales bacterium]
MPAAAAPDAPRRRGPRADGTDTRGAIRAAAAAEFAERGFASATIRSIAARADVDPALVHHYFGSKAALFRDVTQIPVDPAAGLPGVLAGPPEQLGMRLARHVLTLWEDPAFRTPLLTIVRSALVDPERARPLREYLESQLLPAVARELPGPDAPQRVVLAATQLIGIVLGRHVVGLAELTRPTVEQLAGRVAPTVQRYLDGTDQA